jgi:dihydroorotase
MNLKHLFIFTVLFTVMFSVQAQSPKSYNIVIKGGHVIDPKNNINTLMDIAIKDGKVAMIAKDIDASEAIQVVNAKGMYVTPGLIDMHVHFFWGHDGEAYMNAPASLPADGFTFPAGVTTVVDAGSPGWKTFELYKKQTIDKSQTRVLAFLNIVGQGMAGGKYENDINEMDSQKAAEMAKKYPKEIVGFKLAHFVGRTWVPTDRLMGAGKSANLPVIVDFGGASPFLPLDSLFNVKFRPGDIYTHAFGGNGSTSPNGRESIVDVTTNKVKPFVIAHNLRILIFKRS